MHCPLKSGTTADAKQYLLPLFNEHMLLVVHAIKVLYQSFLRLRAYFENANLLHFNELGQNVLFSADLNCFVIENVLLLMFFPSEMTEFLAVRVDQRPRRVVQPAQNEVIYLGHYCCSRPSTTKQTNQVKHDTWMKKLTS